MWSPKRKDEVWKCSRETNLLQVCRKHISISRIAGAILLPEPRRPLGRTKTQEHARIIHTVIINNVLPYQSVVQKPPSLKSFQLCITVQQSGESVPAGFCFLSHVQFASNSFQRQLTHTYLKLEGRVGTNYDSGRTISQSTLTHGHYFNVDGG